MPAPPHTEGGFTLVELLISLALIVLLVSAVALILPRSMQLTRTDTLTAATNINLVNLVQDFTTSLERSRPVILTRASRTRLDILQLGNPITLNVPSGQVTDGLRTVIMNAALTATDKGAEVVFLNNQGDYLINTITNVTSTPEGTSVSLNCPLNLPGVLRAYPFTRLSYAYATSTGLPQPQRALYRAEQLSALSLSGGQKVSSPWGKLISAQNVQFAPVYGQTTGDFGATLKAPQPRMTIAGQSQPLTSINYAITAAENGHPVTNAGSASIRLAGINAWACGQNVGRPPANTGELQINTSLEGIHPAPGSPQVTVVGPTSTTRINTFAVTILPKMMPGTYTASAQILNANGTSYDPHITRNPTQVSAYIGGTIDVDYQEATGTLQIIEDGLPPQRATQINGSELYKAKAPTRAKTVSITALSSQILPGTYTLTSSQPTIIVNGQTFTATPISATITARKLTTVHVQWKPATGTALIHIQGLPANQKATFQFYGRTPYYLKDFTSPNADVTIGQLLQGNYDLFAFKTSNGYVATVSWQLGSQSGSEPGESGARIPIEPGQTTLVTVTYALPSSGTPNGGTADSFLVWGAVGRPLPTGIVHIRPGLENHLNPAPTPMTAYVMSNLDAVKLPAGWYTIIVTNASSNAIIYRVITYLGSTPAFSLTDIGPEYTIQGGPMPYLNTLYVGDNTRGNLVFYATNEVNRPLKTTITTPNDGVVHSTFDQSLLQYVGSFGVSDGPNGILWQLQNQGLTVDYENYQPIKDNIDNSSQSLVTQRDFCSRTKTGTTFQDCINDYLRYGKWW